MYIAISNITKKDNKDYITKKIIGLIIFFINPKDDKRRGKNKQA